jgi:signal transduction histidine kinase
MKIGPRIMWMSVLPILLTIIVAFGVALYQKGVLEDFFGNEIDEQARREAQKIAQSVYLMCRSAQEAVQKTTNANLRVAEEILRQAGPVSFSPPQVEWAAANQFTRDAQGVVLPRMLVGGKWLGQNHEFHLASPVVDEIKSLVGETVTIFQRMNEQGDMLRVCTNVQRADGRRAIGTYIPARNPDGTPNPVVTALLAGQPFQGRAYVVDAWYVTAYRPIWDAAEQQVIGALYVGVKQESLESLRKGIMDIVVGKTGYVYVLGGTGDQRGRYIISKDGERDGEDLWDSVDAEGHPFIRTIVDKALSLRGEAERTEIPVTFTRYPWRNPGEEQARYKSVAIAYFEPWDWVIGAGYYESDLAASRARMSAALHTMGTWVGTTALVMAFMALPAGYLVTRGTLRQIRGILRTVDEVMLVTDAHDRVLVLSREAERIFRVQDPRGRPRPIGEIIGDVTLANRVEAALAERRSGLHFDLEMPGEGPSRPRVLEGRTSVMQTRNGGLVGMITIIHDVTADREMGRMKNELISTAAHELSTPLASIIGYSELLESTTELPPELYKEAVSYINRKAWALSRIVNELIDLSRIEAGHGITIRRQLCDVNELLREGVNFARNLSGKHSFAVHLPEGVIPLRVDRVKLGQVIENILSNAIKFFPAGGEIRVRGVVRDEGYEVMVEDSGIGMTPEQVAKVFENFYRADTSTTAVEGTGLGMSIVKHIIDAHGGRVWVESELTKGTRVYFLLPFDAAQDHR